MVDKKYSRRVDLSLTNCGFKIGIFQNMRISQLRLSHKITQHFGLGDVIMPRLEKIVLIAGPNGAGKTRLLQAIQAVGTWRYENRSLDLEQLETEIATLKKLYEASKDYAEQARIRHDLIELELQLDKTLALKVNAHRDNKIDIINFVPKTREIAPLREQTLGIIAERSNAISSVGVEHLGEGTFSYIYKAQSQWFEATHVRRPTGNWDGYETSINRYTQLQTLILEILDTKLGRSPAGEPLLFNRTLDEHNLSEGQKVLLQLAVALHAQEKKLNEVILFLDEPESHLHPAALIDIFDRLLSKISKGQLWICTHSVALIAHIAAIDPYALWYMENGKIKRAGKEPQVILAGLMGKPNALGELSAFMSLPHELALSNFAAQCLNPPQTVQTGGSDPQILAIRNTIQEIRKNDTVRILDYGAGKGRLLSGLRENNDDDNDLRRRIDYYAFDEYPADRDECETLINSVYNDSKKRYISNFSDLRSAKSVFDVVVLTNVLHEITPVDWPKIFSHSGIPAILATDGWLLIVEDQRLPVGEEAHEFGFILLDTEQLKILFGVEAEDEHQRLFRWADQRADGRIKAHLIHASLLGRFHSVRQRAAITDLKRQALAEIKLIRQAPNRTYSTGQLHGLWTQLLANASLFLEQGK